MTAINSRQAVAGRRDFAQFAPSPQLAAVYETAQIDFA
jgi:hypothetical protein